MGKMVRVVAAVVVGAAVVVVVVAAAAAAAALGRCRFPLHWLQTIASYKNGVK